MKKLFICVSVVVLAQACEKVPEEIVVVSPTVQTLNPTVISGTTAQLVGSVEHTGGKPILEQGFMLGTEPERFETKLLAVDDFSLWLEGLDYGTTYYYQAFATNEAGTGTGEVKSFTTRNRITFKELTVGNVTPFEITVSGGIEDADGVDVKEQGFRYMEESADSFLFKEADGTATLSGLIASKTYRIWYYAKTADGSFESESISQTTKDGAVSFGPISISGATATSVFVSSSITDDGGSTITQRGFVYGYSIMEPSLSLGTSLSVAVEGTLGAMEMTITDLERGRWFWCQPYAVNQAGTFYGPIDSVELLSGTPTLSSMSAELSDNAESALLSCAVSQLNGASITQAGFCYGYDENPTVDDNVVYAELAGDGTFKATATSLYPRTRYFYRAFVRTNFGDVLYSNADLTPKCMLPVIFYNLTFTNITSVSADVQMPIVGHDGGGNGWNMYASNGLCYSTSPVPTKDDNSIRISTVMWSWSVIPITDLTPSTTYYVRTWHIASFHDDDYTYSRPFEFTTAAE